MQTVPKSNPTPYNRPIAVHCLSAVVGGVNIAVMPHCGNAMSCCCHTAATQFLWPRCATCFLWPLPVVGRPLVFDCGGTRGSPERSILFVGALGDPLRVAFVRRGAR